MDIGTEKPLPEVRNKIQHHLIDVVEPWEEYSVGRYVKDFESVIQSLYQRDKPFVVVGGLLHLKAIMNGLFEGPSADWEYRNYLKSIAMKEGLNALHRMLADIDPEAASKLHFNDQKRSSGHSKYLKRQGKVSRLFRHNLGVIILNITAWRLLLIMIVMFYINV